MTLKPALTLTLPTENETARRVDPGVDQTIQHEGLSRLLESHQL